MAIPEGGKTQRFSGSWMPVKSRSWFGEQSVGDTSAGTNGSEGEKGLLYTALQVPEKPSMLPSRNTTALCRSPPPHHDNYQSYFQKQPHSLSHSISFDSKLLFPNSSGFFPSLVPYFWPGPQVFHFPKVSERHPIPIQKYFHLFLSHYLPSVDHVGLLTLKLPNNEMPRHHF